MGLFGPVEIEILRFIQSLGAWLLEPMRFFSFLGTEEALMVILPAIYWCIDAALGLRIGLMLLFTTGMNNIFKAAFHLPRPYWVDPAIKAYAAESSFGLPSGHAQISASVWGLLALKSRRTIYIVLMIILVALIGFSRWYLGIHFISDVVVGWLIGALFVFLFLRIDDPATDWIRRQNAIVKIALAFFSSILLIGIHTAIAVSPQAAIPLPAEWLRNALLAPNPIPIAPYDNKSIITVAGTLFGLSGGAVWLAHSKMQFSANGNPGKKITRYFLGIAVTLFLWYGLRKLTPESTFFMNVFLRYLRYTLIGLWVSAGAPFLFIRLHLVDTRKNDHSLA